MTSTQGFARTHPWGADQVARVTQSGLAICAAATALMCWAAVGPAVAQTYTYTSINVPSAAVSEAWGINNAGQIVGFDSLGKGDSFVYSGGVFTPIIVPQASSNTAAFSINNSGQIVGSYDAGTSGFLYNAGVYTSLTRPAYGINDYGVIVGYVPNSASNTGYLYNNGSYTPISFPGAQSTLPSGINNAGQIVGSYEGPGVLQSGFLYSHGTYTTIYVPGSSYTSVQSINDAGQIVGSFQDATGVHPFIYSNGTYTTLVGSLLTNLSYASGINDLGQIVGQFYNPLGNGFLANPLIDLGGANLTIGSLSGAGLVTNSGIASPATLTVGSSNTSTTYVGIIQDGNSTTALTKVGIGTLTLAGINTYTGATTINGGELYITGSIANSILTSVNPGGMLAGDGTVGNVHVNSGGVFAPGNGTPGSSMTVSGNLALQAGAIYLVQLNPATASLANISGTATPGGATVDALWANGSYISKQYTILTASAGVSGAFAPTVVSTNLPANFRTTLSYDANNAYLNLILNFTPPGGPNFPGGLNGNQQNVGNALTNYFNSTGGIPMVYATLSPAGLSQAAGETATGSQQTTFDAMTQFLGLLLDPFIDGRGSASGPASNVPAFAEQDDQADAAAARRKRSAAERDAYAAVYRKAPPATPFAPSWSVWAAGYGGSQTTDGNVALGSNTTTSRVYGTAVGADYRFSPFTIAGFALAGGGTNFSIASALGTGRSDLFQAGAYLRHTQGAAYLSAALAYGWQDITTNRTVTIAGIDQLRAEFNANAYSGRLEGGYRFVTPWMGGFGVTPYGAGHFTTFDLPAYAEQVISGANTFALSYAAKSVTDSRSELGIRTDKSWAMTDSILTLRGRFAWAHDFNPDRGVGATFQALPGSSFIVNGAAQASDSALTTASAELKWKNGWSAAATFEGEFSQVTRSYAGKGAVRYAW